MTVVLEDVGLHRGDGPAVLDGVSARIDAGELVCVLGASGCGKSTLLHLLAGLERPSAGRLSAPEGGAAVLFQDPALFPWLTARGNVELALRLAGVPARARRRRAEDLLGQVGLAEAAGRRPHELSGGMRQRVALARALAQDRPLLLLDEPFAALDVATRARLHDLIETVWRAGGRTVVFVTHQVDEAVRLGRRILLLDGAPGRVGRCWEVPDHVRRDPASAQALEAEIAAALGLPRSGDPVAVPARPGTRERAAR